MSRLRTGLLALVLAAPGWAGPAPAGPTDEQLKQAALKLTNAATLDTALEAADALLRPRPDAQRLVKLAVKMQREAAGKALPLKFNAARALAEVARIVKEYDAAEGLLESCAATAKAVGDKGKLAQVQSGWVSLYFAQKRWADADAAATTGLELAEELEAANKPSAGLMISMIERQVEAKALAGNTDEALARADEAARVFKPIAAYFLPLRATVLAEAGRPAEAAAALEKFLAQADALKEPLGADTVDGLKRGARYRLSGHKVDAGDVDGAVAVLRELLQENPDSSTFHNDLGFVLADHGKELAEAERLCRKAVELDAAARKKALDEGKADADAAKQENAAYLDSLGWVLFKQDKLKDALPLLAKAAADEDEGRHIEIWDHWADCLLKLGDTAKAVATWEKCLTFDDVSKRDVDRRKKVSAKLKAAKTKKADD